MSQAAIKERSPLSPPYKRHQPEQTLLYHIIERHYPAFRDMMSAQGKDLLLHVQQEFADYLKCGRLEHGFTGGAGAQAEGEPDPVSWHVCAEQQIPCRCNARQTWQRFQAS
jgi:hypothetical protein